MPSGDSRPVRPASGLDGLGAPGLIVSGDAAMNGTAVGSGGAAGPRAGGASSGRGAEWRFSPRAGRRGLVEHQRPALRGHHDVLDADAVATFEIDARLDAERHSWPQKLAVSGDEVGVFVFFEPDSVAGAVDEVVAVAAAGDDAPRDRI